MSTKTIQVKHRVGNALVSAAEIALRDPDNTYGIRRMDNQAVLVGAGTLMHETSVGVYEYTFTEPASNLIYEYWIDALYKGEHKRLKQTLNTIVSNTLPSVPPGNVGSGPIVYINLGLQIVGCGDDALTVFLSQQAQTVWAMQVRKGVVLDLHYQYYVLDLTSLAMDYVRLLIDKSVGATQMGSTGYSNALRNSDMHATSVRDATSSTTASSNATQSSSQSAGRTSGSVMSTSGNTDGTQTGAGSDTGFQNSSMTRTRIASNVSATTTTPFLDGTHYDYKESHNHSFSGVQSNETFDRYSESVLFIGSFSGQSGSKDVDIDAARSQARLIADDHGTGTTTRRNTVDGRGSLIDNSTMLQNGTKQNNSSRTSGSNMTGSSSMTASGSMSASSHSEGHQASTSAMHAQSNASANSESTSIAHSESAGANSLATQGSNDTEYYSQIFESLQQIWDDTKKQIERLEQQVLLPFRYLVQKLPIKTPQAKNIRVASLLTDRRITVGPNSPVVFGNSNLFDPRNIQ